MNALAVSIVQIVTPDLFRGPEKSDDGGACCPGPRNKSGVT